MQFLCIKAKIFLIYLHFLLVLHQFLVLYNDFWLYSPSKSSHIHPFPVFPSSCLFSKPTKRDFFCCPNILGIVVFCWSVLNFQMLSLFKKSSPFLPRSYELPVFPCSGVGLCAQPHSMFAMDWVCADFMHTVIGAYPEGYPKVFLCSHPPSLALILCLAPFKQWSLSYGRESSEDYIFPLGLIISQSLIFVVICVNYYLLKI